MAYCLGPVLPLLTLKHKLTMGEISPDAALLELSTIADDVRYPPGHRAAILTELAYLNQPSQTVLRPHTVRLFTSPSPQHRREAVKLIIDQILSPQELKDWEAAQRHAQRMGDRAARKVERTTAVSSDAQAQSGTGANGGVGTGAAVQPEQPKPKQRGAPIKIPEARKAEALAIKTRGGSNRDAAKALYATPRPTVRQVKDAGIHVKRYLLKIGQLPNNS
jgi:hypothetical protein